MSCKYPSPHSKRRRMAAYLIQTCRHHNSVITPSKWVQVSNHSLYTKMVHRRSAKRWYWCCRKTKNGKKSFWNTRSFPSPGWEQWRLTTHVPRSRVYSRDMGLTSLYISFSGKVDSAFWLDLWLHLGAISLEIHPGPIYPYIYSTTVLACNEMLRLHVQTILSCCVC